MAQQLTAGSVPPSVTLIRNRRLLSVGSYWSSVSTPGSTLAVVFAHVVQVSWSVDSSKVKPTVGLVPSSLPRQTLTIAFE